MKRSAFILLLLSLSLSTIVRAQQPDTTALFDCGERVLIQAVAKPGYRFVRWSDNVTDSERWVDIDEDQELELTATFEPLCREPQAPVDRVYDWLLVVNRAELMNEGWLTTEASDDSVRWYKIIEPIDPIGIHDFTDPTCDRMVMRGFSLALKDGEKWENYYAEVNVDAAKAEKEYMCTTVMRGFSLIRSDLPYTSTPLLPYTQKYEKDGIIYIKRNNQIYTIYGIPINNNK